MAKFSPFEYTPHSETKHYKKALEKFIMDRNLPHFVTFNFNRRCSANAANKYIRRWHARVDRYLLGRNWSKKASDERTEYIGFIENIESNTHVHTMLRYAQSNRSVPIDVQIAFWKKIVPGGQLDIQLARSRRKVASYITKALKCRAHYESFLISGC